MCVEVLRSRRGHVTGNWSYTRAEFGRDRMPAWCNGWLSITMPKVGAELAQVDTTLAFLRNMMCGYTVCPQVGLALYGETGAPHGDSLVTGLPSSSLSSTGSST